MYSEYWFFKVGISYWKAFILGAWPDKTSSNFHIFHRFDTFQEAPKFKSQSFGDHTVGNSKVTWSMPIIGQSHTIRPKCVRVRRKYWHCPSSQIGEPVRVVGPRGSGVAEQIKISVQYDSAGRGPHPTSEISKKVVLSSIRRCSILLLNCQNFCFIKIIHDETSKSVVLKS